MKKIASYFVCLSLAVAPLGAFSVETPNASVWGPPQTTSTVFERTFPSEDLNQDAAAVDPNPDPNKLNLKWFPDGTANEQIEMHAITTEGGEDLAEPAKALLEGKTADAVVQVVPDDPKAVTPEYLAKSAKLAAAIPSKSVQQVKLAKKSFGEWFSTNKTRITVVLIEATVMGSLKFAELMIAPAPIAFASALTAAVMIGGLIGATDWHILKVSDFIMKPGQMISGMFERITGGANATAKNLKARQRLKTIWEYTKNVEVNFVLFGVFKIILFATTQVDGSLLDGFVSAIHSVGARDVVDWAKMAVEATMVSFPMSKVLRAKFVRDVKAANGDPAATLKAKNLFITFNTVALTSRAVLFSSLMLASTMHWPLLAYAAYSGLGLMMAGSLGQWWSDARNAPKLCSRILAQ